ncbi:unnamed protein product [Periconia digitata]|uniref:Uncharacterized protein n=1 Tax=Periconia digitata TaxID=1303443 RepID=A0A9W4U4J1_9PLEO|nr:unnamed protein product [Periconia digitata]
MPQTTPLPTTLLPPQQPLRPTSTTDAKPLPYTGSPMLLFLSDVRLLFRNASSLPGIMLPIIASPPSPLDELFPSPGNMLCLALHSFLIVVEFGFLLSLPALVFVPLWAGMLWVVGVFGVVGGVSWVLNGEGEVRSRSGVLNAAEMREREKECWVFLNGVSVGHHWLQNNVDRIAQTFRRPILGVHNRTYGIIFDLIQCLIERNFCYATDDIRRSYAIIREKLLNPDYTKVVLILHSQGGIEGSLILDWLLGELSHDIIHKLEIYTFGSAANHFNNPLRHVNSESSKNEHVHANAVRHIEHYTNNGEFVARWGAITFAHTENRYMGRMFIRPGSGHLLNQHYLKSMFPLGKDGRVMERNAFMDMDVELPGHHSGDHNTREYVETVLNEGDPVGGEHEQPRPVRTAKVKDFSRLWGYRNGMNPPE